MNSEILTKNLRPEYDFQLARPRGSCVFKLTSHRHLLNVKAQSFCHWFWIFILPLCKTLQVMGYQVVLKNLIQAETLSPKGFLQ